MELNDLEQAAATGGKYCDTMGHCYPTPQALAGHCSQTGHPAIVPGKHKIDRKPKQKLTNKVPRLKKDPGGDELGFYLEEKYGERIANDVAESIEQWEVDGYWEGAGEFWTIAGELTGGKTLEKAPISGKKKQAMLDLIAHHQNLVKQITKGKPLTVYRTIKYDGSDVIQLSKKTGESVTVSPYAMESWTTSLKVAKDFSEKNESSVIVKRQVKPEEVMFYWPATESDLGSHWKEVTLLGKPYEISPKDVAVIAKTKMKELKEEKAPPKFSRKLGSEMSKWQKKYAWPNSGEGTSEFRKFVNKNKNKYFKDGNTWRGGGTNVALLDFLGIEGEQRDAHMAELKKAWGKRFMQASEVFNPDEDPRNLDWIRTGHGQQEMADVLDDVDVADDGSLEVEWYPVPDWLAEEFGEEPAPLQQAKVYLKPGQNPPKGAVAKRGEKGGYYYDTKERVKDVHEQRSKPSRLSHNPFEPRKKKVLPEEHEVAPEEKDLAPWHRTPKLVDAPPLWADVPDLPFEVAKVMPDREAKMQAKEDFEKAKKFCAADPYRDVHQLYTHYQEHAENYKPFTDAWASSSRDPHSAPIWAYAMKTYHNENIHEGPSVSEVTAEDLVKVGAIAKKTQEMARVGNPTYDPKTDTIALYRGVGGDQARDLYEGWRTKKSVFADHHAVESWSASPERAAKGFGTLLISARVQVSSLVGSFQTVELHSASEAEYIVGTPFGKALYHPDNILPHGHGGGDGVDVWGQIRQLRDEQKGLWREHYGLKDFEASEKKVDSVLDEIFADAEAMLADEGGGLTQEWPNKFIESAVDVSNNLGDKYAKLEDLSDEERKMLGAKLHQKLYKKQKISQNPFAADDDHPPLKAYVNKEKVSTAHAELADMEMLAMWEESGHGYEPSDQQLSQFVDTYVDTSYKLGKSPALGGLVDSEEKELKKQLTGYLKNHLELFDDDGPAVKTSPDGAQYYEPEPYVNDKMVKQVFDELASPAIFDAWLEKGEDADPDTIKKFVHEYAEKSMLNKSSAWGQLTSDEEKEIEPKLVAYLVDHIDAVEEDNDD